MKHTTPLPPRRASLAVAFLAAAFGILISSPVPAAQVPREWTDIQGRKITATLLGVEADSVTLKMPDGRTVPFPLARLSPADQAYAESNKAALAADPFPDTAPAAPAAPGPAAPAAPAPVMPQAAPAGAPPPAAGDAPKALATWPKTVKLPTPPAVTVVTEDKEKSLFAYRSAHFDFESDIRVGASALRELATMLETTYLLACTLPLDLAPGGGDTRFKVRICRTLEAVAQAGGKGAGSFETGRDATLLSLSVLGLEANGNRVTSSKTPVNQELILREAMNHMMHRVLERLPLWLAEGTAAYVTCLDYRSGKFSIPSPRSMMREKFPKETEILTPAKMLAMNKMEWEYASRKSDLAALNLNSARLLAIYFFHIDGEGDAKHATAFFKDVAGGADKDQATATHLFRGRSSDQLAKDMLDAFGKLGLDVTIKDVAPAPDAQK